MKNEIFTIQILEDKDYDALHEQFSNISKEDLAGSLGFADKEKGEAYVRKTNVAGIDESTMQHELQELLAKNSSHEDLDGIRWKKGKDIFKNVVAPIVLSMINPALGAAYAGVNNYQTSGSYGKAALAAATTYAGAKMGGGGKAFSAGAKASKGGILGKTLSGLKGAAVGTPATSTSAATTGLIGTRGAVLGLGTTPTSAMRGALQGPVTASQAGMGYTNLSQVPTATAPLLSNIASQTTPVNQQVTQAAPKSTLGKITETVGSAIKKPSTVLGGASVLGSMATPTPSFEMPQEITDLRTKLSTGSMTPLGEQAKASLSQLLQSTPDAQINVRLTDLEKEYQDQQTALANRWNAIDENYQKRGDYQLESNDLNERYMMAKDRITAEATSELNQQKLSAIQQAFNVEQNTANAMLDIASLDAWAAAQKYGISAEAAQEIRQALSQIGVGMIQQGFTKSGSLNSGMQSQ